MKSSLLPAAKCCVCYRVYWCLAALLLFSAAAMAQTDSTLVQTTGLPRCVVETKDGSVLQGLLLEQDANSIRIQTESSGELTILRSQITRFQVLDEHNFKHGEYWFDNPNATRYLFSPTGFSLRKGEAYYQNTYLVVNSFNYGVTDRFTIGGGFELISTFTGNPIVFITPKYSFPISEKVHAGAGVLYLNSTAFEDDFSGLGIGYGIVTYGNTNNNATLGLGYGYVDGSFSSKPIFTLSGMTRISRKVGLVTENWIVPNGSYYGLFSYGLRFMSEKLTVDLAFVNNSDIAQEIAIGVPYVDFVIKFGK
ncbi:hypothetical protein [Pontibacter chitinilyticus]|uniref:hypothetical protein n=1 Tax=Pontibacter chitinilyticus TaxID=2674989 RepID=UPI0032191219